VKRERWNIEQLDVGWKRQKEAKVERKMLLLDLLKRAHEMEVQFVEALSDEQRARTGTLEDWSAKDVIAHNAAWKARRADNLLAVSEGRPPTETGDVDLENARFFEAYCDQTWEEVLSAAAGAFQRLLAQVEALGDQELVSCEVFPGQGERPLWRIIVGTAYTHPIVHLAEFYRNQGNRETAAHMIGEMARSMAGLDDGPAWQGTVKYNLACHYSLLGAAGEAIRELRDALALDPGLTDWSRQDRDLYGIRGEAGYVAVYEGRDEGTG
jgi:tetratricopeptide (TPR) repeat protein